MLTQCSLVMAIVAPWLFNAHLCASVTVRESMPPEDGCSAATTATEGDHLMVQYSLYDVDSSSSEPSFATTGWEQRHVHLGHHSPAFDVGLDGACEGESRTLTFDGQEFDSEYSDGTVHMRAEVRVLTVTKSADFDIFTPLRSDNISAVLDMIDNHVGVNAVDEFGNTPLMTAVQLNLSMLIAALLNSWRPKVKVNFSKPSGHNVLFYAVAQPSSVGASTTLKALLKRGADPNQALNQADSAGWTPLHFACKFENVKNAQLLLDYGANPMALTADGQTVLDAAAGAPYSVRKKLAGILNEAVERSDEAQRNEGSARSDL